MRLKMIEVEGKTKITFLPETKREKQVMGTLRQHFFWGNDEKGTYPKYGGITTEGNFVKTLSLEFNWFDNKTKDNGKEIF